MNVTKNEAINPDIIDLVYTKQVLPGTYSIHAEDASGSKTAIQEIKITGNVKLSSGIVLKFESAAEAPK